MGDLAGADPGTAAKLDRGELRDLLLGNLNTPLAGAAGGELFNGSGRTEVLIRSATATPSSPVALVMQSIPGRELDRRPRPAPLGAVALAQSYAGAPGAPTSPLRTVAPVA